MLTVKYFWYSYNSLDPEIIDKITEAINTHDYDSFMFYYKNLNRAVDSSGNRIAYLPQYGYIYDSKDPFMPEEDIDITVQDNFNLIVQEARCDVTVI